MALSRKAATNHFLFDWLKLLGLHCCINVKNSNKYMGPQMAKVIPSGVNDVGFCFEMMVLFVWLNRLVVVDTIFVNVITTKEKTTNKRVQLILI